MSTDRPFEFRENTHTVVEAPVVVLVAGEAEVMAKTANISRGGLFVAMGNPPPVGTTVRLTLELENRKIQAFAEVVWIRLKSTNLDQPTGMGVQFRHFLHNGYQRLLDFLPDSG